MPETAYENSSSTAVLETERLVLRQLTEHDGGFILELLNEPSFIRNIGDRQVRNLKSARQYVLKGPVASYRRYGFGMYLVELKTSGAPIGLCGLIRRNSLQDVDIGYAFLPPFWSQGYALESATAVLAYARDTLRLKRIVAITAPDNDPSIRLLEKIGLKFDKMIRLSANEPEIKLFAIDL